MTKVVSREAVIDQLHQSINLFEAEDRIMSLPLQHTSNADEKHVGNALEMRCDDLLRREAVIKAVDVHTNKDGTLDDDISVILEDLPFVTQKPETVTEFADRCRECGARYGKMLEQKSGKWIPVSERLPEDAQEVLYSTKTGRVFHGEYYDDNTDRKWFSYKDDIFSFNNVVIAWMPLPEPYKIEVRNRE